MCSRNLFLEYKRDICRLQRLTRNVTKGRDYIYVRDKKQHARSPVTAYPVQHVTLSLTPVFSGERGCSDHPWASLNGCATQRHVVLASD